MSATMTREGSGAMFDHIAGRYDLLNRVMSFGQDRRWRRHLVGALDLPARSRVLDVATGTADVALAIARAHSDASVIGLDPSAQMLAVGAEKVSAQELDGRIDLVEGDAQQMRFADDSFDAACISFGIRNVPDRGRALAEMVRVVRPGGRVAVLELTEPDGRLARFHIRRVVPWLGRRLSSAGEYDYLQRSIRAFPKPEDFANTMTSAGLRDVSVRRFSLGAVVLLVGRVGAPPPTDSPGDR